MNDKRKDKISIGSFLNTTKKYSNKKKNITNKEIY